MDKEVAKLQELLAKMTSEEQAEAIADLRLGALKTIAKREEGSWPEEYSLAETEEAWDNRSSVSCPKIVHILQ